jgi:hypothetical protein
MTDYFASYPRTLDAPASDGFAITPSDSADLVVAARSIYIGGDGDVSLITTGGTTLTFTGLLAGTILPVRAQRVRVTGTTASNLIGLV